MTEHARLLLGDVDAHHIQVYAARGIQVRERHGFRSRMRSTENRKLPNQDRLKPSLELVRPNEWLTDQIHKVVLPDL